MWKSDWDYDCQHLHFLRLFFFETERLRTKITHSIINRIELRTCGGSHANLVSRSTSPPRNVASRVRSWSALQQGCPRTGRGYCKPGCNSNGPTHAAQSLLTSGLRPPRPGPSVPDLPHLRIRCTSAPSWGERPAAGWPIPMERWHQCGVDGQLCSSPLSQPICHTFQLASIKSGFVSS